MTAIIINGRCKKSDSNGTITHPRIGATAEAGGTPMNNIFVLTVTEM